MNAGLNKKVIKRLAVTVAIVSGLAQVSVPRVEAMMVPAPVAAQVSQANRQADLAKVQTALENKIVRHRLAELGLTADEINHRMAGLSDTQLHEVAMQADKQQAAGDAGATVLIVIAAIALLALIISLLKHSGPHDHVVRDDHGGTTTTTVQQPAGTTTTTAPAAAPAAPQPDQKTIIVK